jgi:hypothetical protein
MSQINQLSSISTSELTTGDNLVVWSNQNGDSRKLSFGNLVDYIQSNITAGTFITTISTPGDGFNITIEQDSQNRWALLRPTGSLATGTIVLPAPAVSIDGQEILVTTTAQIATFTLNGNGASNVYGSPTVLAADDSFKIKYNSQTTSWYKVA